MARTTLADIAARTGFSKNTVSLALRESPRLSLETRTRVQAVARELGYRVDPLVSTLMAEIRASARPAFRAQLALINANRAADAFESHPTIPHYVAGIRRRADRLGFGLDTFWLHQPGTSPERWQQILQARGLRGLLLVGLMDQNVLPPRFAPLWASFPVVVTGVLTHEPALPGCCVDHHDLVRRAFAVALERGYQRPALVLDATIDHLVDQRFSAGFHTAQTALPADRRIPPFHEVRAADENPAAFNRWFRRHRPDLLFTLYNDPLRWLRDLGLAVPRDIAVVQLEWRPEQPEIAGMHQHNDRTGEAAVDMLLSQIQNRETGLTASARSTFIRSSWVEGASIRGPAPEAARAMRGAL